MKMVFLINSLEGGGAERVISTLAAYLVRAKQCVITVVTLHPSSCWYDLPPSVEVRHLRTGTLCVGPGKVLAIPLLALEFARLLRALRPDATLSLLVRSNLVHLLTRWFGNRSKIFISERCDSMGPYSGRGLRDRVMRLLIRRLYPRATGIIAISEGVKDSLVKLGVPGGPVVPIYNPQDVAGVQLKSRGSIDADVDLGPPGAKRLIAVGRLVDQKDHRTLLRALKLIREEIDARLIVLGDGPLRDSLKAYAESLGVLDAASWLGWRSNPFAIMARCDLFVFTSKYEGFGNVLIEAMACGLPIVSTDCPSGPREILDDGRYGALVPVGDSDAVARAVTKILLDKPLYEALRGGGYERAAQFDVGLIGPKYLEIVGQAR